MTTIVALRRILAASVSAALLLMALAVTASADPGGVPVSPHVLYGDLLLGGAPAANRAISVTVSGVTTVVTSNGSGTYYLDLAANDPANGQTGGIDGDIITFQVGGSEIIQTVTYASGSVTQVDLTNQPFTSTVTKDVPGGSAVSFSMGNGAVGVVVDPGSNNLGSTTVQIKANQSCTTIAGETVARCFEITPTTAAAADVTVYFYEDQLPTGDSCNDMNLYHWNGSTWDGPLSRDATFGSDGRACQASPFAASHAIRVTGVTDFSPFVLKAAKPTAVTHIQFGAGTTGAQSRLLWWGMVLTGVLGAGLFLGKKGSAVTLGPSGPPSSAPMAPASSPPVETAPPKSGSCPTRC